MVRFTSFFVNKVVESQFLSTVQFVFRRFLAAFQVAVGGHDQSAALFWK
jgi:hypothetical protein